MVRIQLRIKKGDGVINERGFVNVVAFVVEVVAKIFDVFPGPVWMQR
jgi:hypothetical protein